MNWTEEWPTESGRYWFYGWLDGDRDLDARYHYMEVFSGRHGLGCVTDGQIVYSDARGIWCEAEIPAPDTQVWTRLLQSIVEEYDALD